MTQPTYPHSFGAFAGGHPFRFSGPHRPSWLCKTLIKATSVLPEMGQVRSQLRLPPPTQYARPCPSTPTAHSRATGREDRRSTRKRCEDGTLAARAKL